MNNIQHSELPDPTTVPADVTLDPHVIEVHVSCKVVTNYIQYAKQFRETLMPNRVQPFIRLLVVLGGILGISLMIIAQTPTKAVVKFVATTANTATAGQSVRIEVYGWSSDADRDQLTKAWTSPPTPPPAAADEERGGGGGGRGG